MKRFVPPLLIVLITTAVFAPIVGHDFTNLDDQQTIAQNGDLRPPTFQSLQHLWTTEAAGLYVPFTYTMWWLIAHVAFDGMSMHAWPFHLAGVLLHAANGLLVLLILRRLRFKQMPSFFGAILFVIHPVQVETVAWASGAKDQLAALFSLAAIATYFRNASPSPRTRGGGRGEGPAGFSFSSDAKTEYQDSDPNPLPKYGARERVAWLSILLMVLAMLSKPVTIVTPLIIAAIGVIDRRQTVRCVSRRLWPILFAVIPVAVIARSVQTVWPAVVTPLWQRPLIAGDALAFYLAKLVWPATLTHLYGRTPMLMTSAPELYWTWTLPALMGLIVLSQWRRRPAVATGAAIFVVALLPVLGFTPFEFQIHSTVADHYLYLPMAGVAMVFAEGVDALVGGQASERRQAEPEIGRASHAALLGHPYGLLIPAVLLVALAVRSELQIPVWRDSITLHSHAVAVQPQSVDAHGSLAIALAEAGQLEAAVPHLQFVVTHVPENRMGHLRIAQVWLGLKRFDRALPEAQAAVQLTPNQERDPTPNLMLAEALIGLGRFEEATAALDAARRLDPANPRILDQIAALGKPATQP